MIKLAANNIPLVQQNTLQIGKPRNPNRFMAAAILKSIRLVEFGVVFAYSRFAEESC